MSTPARRDLELRLKIVADTQQGIAAMNQLAQAAQKVESAGARARMALGAPGGGAAVAGPPATAGGGTLLGFGKAALGFFAAQQTIQRGGAIGGILQDSFATGTQQARAIAKQLDPLGIIDAYDSLSGRKDLMAREALRYDQAMAGIQGQGQIAGFTLNQSIQQAGLRSRAAGLAGAPAMLEGYSNRNTALGERQFQEKQRLLQVDREIAKAERESAAASAQRVAAEKEMIRLDRESGRLSGSWYRQANSLSGGGVDRQRDLNRLSEIESQITINGQLRQQAAQQAAASRQQELQRQYASGSLRAQRFGVQAGILEEQAATAASGAARLGGMQPWDRADAVYNLELLQRFGPDMLAPEQLAAAQGIAPQTVAKILEQRGRQTGEFQRLQQLAPADFAGDPNDLRTRASELRDQQVKQQLELERVMAEGAAEAGEKMGAAVVDAMQQVVDMAIKTIRTRLLQAKNASS